MVPGATTLRDLIRDAEECGCRLTRASGRIWSLEYGGEPYVPEYLERDGKHVPLPPTNDRDVVIGPEIAAQIWRRLGLDEKIKW